ncbi:MAG: hypothetical protein SR2Q5_06825 [Quinella sp. 2Q5]|nr:hypothetical protein [Quinella sp. 2Q5]
MTDEIISKMTADAAELNLPDEICGFTSKKILAPEGDRFIFATFADDEIHCALTIYFHTETMEFKLRQRIGLTEFCLTKFFTQDFSRFRDMLNAELADTLNDLRDLQRGKLNDFLRAKGLDAWAYELPAELEGFELYIKPAAPVEVTNGSFIVINYADFNSNSDFAISYNIYTDGFSGESRIDGAPHVTYAFDAAELNELEGKLKKNLSDELRNIRRQLDA